MVNVELETVVQEVTASKEEKGKFHVSSRSLLYETLGEISV